MSVGSLAGVPISRAFASVPAWGVPWFDVELTDPRSDLTGKQTLELGGLAIACTVLSGGEVNGRASYRLAAGAGGWGQELPATAPWTDDLGVKLANVAGAAASACGETLADVPSTRLGPHFVRAAGPASAVMHTLAPRAWYVGFDGVTRFGQRSTTAYTGDGVRTRVDHAVGVYELTVESLAGLVPGATVDGSAPAVDVEYELDSKSLVARLYVAARPRGRLAAWARIVTAIDPRARYRGTYEFRVVTQVGERLNLQPVRVSSGLPDLPRVPVRLAPGVRANFFLGCQVLVTFVDADPARPVVIAGPAPDAPGWMPLSLEFGGPGALPIARATDPVVAGPFGGAIVGIPSSRIKSGV